MRVVARCVATGGRRTHPLGHRRNAASAPDEANARLRFACYVVGQTRHGGHRQQGWQRGRRGSSRRFARHLDTPGPTTPQVRTLASPVGGLLGVQPSASSDFLPRAEETPISEVRL